MDIISHGHDDPSRPGPAPAAEVRRLRQALAGFELGRFLLDNLGLNGRWTSYVLMHPERGARSGLSSDGTPLCELEAWLLGRCPIMLATQQRFRRMRALTQPLLRSGMRLASLPSGLMDDLLTLDYSDIEDIILTAVDLDPQALCDVRRNLARLDTSVVVECEQRDAWQLDCRSRWDLITSNGLNIYVEDDDLCTDFYRQVARALRPQGLFVVSFITPPQQWRPSVPSDLERQRLLFQEVVPVRWSCCRDEVMTRRQLAAAGFEVLSVCDDDQRMFPAVLARRREPGD